MSSCQVILGAAVSRIEDFPYREALDSTSGTVWRGVVSKNVPVVAHLVHIVVYDPKSSDQRMRHNLPYLKDTSAQYIVESKPLTPARLLSAVRRAAQNLPGTCCTILTRINTLLLKPNIALGQCPQGNQLLYWPKLEQQGQAGSAGNVLQQFINGNVKVAMFSSMPHLLLPSLRQEKKPRVMAGVLDGREGVACVNPNASVVAVMSSPEMVFKLGSEAVLGYGSTAGVKWACAETTPQKGRPVIPQKSARNGINIRVPQICVMGMHDTCNLCGVSLDLGEYHQISLAEHVKVSVSVVDDGVLLADEAHNEPWKDIQARLAKCHAIRLRSGQRKVKIRTSVAFRGVATPSTHEVKPADLSSLLTVNIKTMGRMHLVKRLVDSLKTALSHSGLPAKVKVHVADDGDTSCTAQATTHLTHLKIPIDRTCLPLDSGLSKSRNVLVEQTKTPYFLLLDDDFILDDRSNILVSLGILLSHPEMKIAFGRIEKDYMSYSGNLHTINKKLFLHYPQRSSVKILGPCRIVDISPNIFFARTDFLRSVGKAIDRPHPGPWDIRLKLGEHEEFFWQVQKLLLDPATKMSGVLASCDDHFVIQHKQAPHDPEYQRFRGRGGDFKRAMLHFNNLDGMVDFMGEEFRGPGIVLKHARVLIVSLDDDDACNVLDETLHPAVSHDYNVVCFTFNRVPSQLPLMRKVQTLARRRVNLHVPCHGSACRRSGRLQREAVSKWVSSQSLSPKFLFDLTSAPHIDMMAVHSLLDSPCSSTCAKGRMQWLVSTGGILQHRCACLHGSVVSHRCQLDRALIVKATSYFNTIGYRQGIKQHTPLCDYARSFDPNKSHGDMPSAVIRVALIMPMLCAFYLLRLWCKRFSEAKDRTA